MSRIKKLCEELRDLTLRRFPSSIHEVVWQDFEKLLMYRSMMSQLSRIINVIAVASIGGSIWKQSEEYVSGGEPKNHDFAMEVQPYAQTAYMLCIAGRLILFIL